MQFLDRSSAMLRAIKIDELEDEILARSPRPAARTHVSLTIAPGRSAFLSSVRLAGARDDVLDFAAVLFDEVRGMVRPDGTLPLRVQAIESESSEHIQLLLSRELYEA
jgi:hypothetical protein